MLKLYYSLKSSIRVKSILSGLSGRSPPLYGTLILIAMQGHQNRRKHDRLGTQLRYMMLGLGSGVQVFGIGFMLNTKQKYC